MCNVSAERKPLCLIVLELELKVKCHGPVNLEVVRTTVTPHLDVRRILQEILLHQLVPSVFSGIAMCEGHK
jgi:hypothetical protein